MHMADAQGLRAITRFRHGIAMRFKDLLRQAPNHVLIFHEKNRF